MPLFERVAKDRVIPTSAGRALVELAKPFIGELSALVDELQRGHATILRIESSGLVLRSVVAPWAPRIRAAASNIELRIDEIVRPDPTRVLAGATDLLVDFVPKIPAGLNSVRVAMARAFLIVGRSHQLATRKRIRVGELDGCDFVAYPEGTLHRELQDRALGDAGATPRTLLTASSAESILALVRAGMGTSIIPWIDGGPVRRGVSMHRVGGKRGTFPIRAIWRKSSRKDPALAAALKTLAKV